jgi:hypothetical protein
LDKLLKQCESLSGEDEATSTSLSSINDVSNLEVSEFMERSKKRRFSSNNIKVVPTTTSPTPVHTPSKTQGDSSRNPGF